MLFKIFQGLLGFCPFIFNGVIIGIEVESSASAVAYTATTWWQSFIANSVKPCTPFNASSTAWGCICSIIVGRANRTGQINW